MPTALLLLALFTSPESPDALVEVPVATEKAMAFYRSGVVLWFVGQAWLVLVPAAILFSGASAKIRQAAKGRGRSWFLTIGLYAMMYLAIQTLITLPLSYYLGFVRPHQYGLSVETLGKWIGDEAKGLGIGLVMAFLGLWLPYLALRKLPRGWPFAVALGYVPIAFALMFFSPIVVDPLFNKFGPMNDKALEADILALAGRAGIEGGRIFEVDKSRETTTINAYVKGFGESKRIVLWDTLLKKLDRRQVLFVMGHEMGHFVLGHVSRTLLVGTLGILACALFVQGAGTILTRRFASRFGFDRLDDVASLPLLLLLGNLCVFAASPVGMAYSRHQEHEADRFALELTRDNSAGGSAFAAMQKENLSNPRPGPLSVLWRATHPPLGERIDFCNTYKPWKTGEPLQYTSLFREGM